MEKIVLQSMTDFVVKQNTRYANKEISIEKLQLVILNHAVFLKQPLTLGMFLPIKLINGKWIVLEEPKDWKNWQHVYIANNTEGKTKDRYTSQLAARRDCLEYQEAKERVLFDGFTPCITNRVQSVHHENCSVHFQLINKETIESISKCNLLLTESAKTQIGL